MDDYFAAKAELFTPRYARAGVVNIDDARGRRARRRGADPGHHVLGGRAAAPPTGGPWTYGRGADGSHVPGDRARRRRGRRRGGAARRVQRRQRARARSWRWSRPAWAWPPPWPASPPARACPAGWSGSSRGQDFTVLVDYAHKPGAVEAVLAALRPVTAGSLLIVLGCGGDRDRGKRPLMGAAAARLADMAILTNDNPRSEDPLAILAEMLAGALEVPQRERAQVVVQPDRAAAIGLAIARAGKGDVVLIAGKGHERGQYMAGAVIPFDDREVAAEALAHRRERRGCAIAGGPRRPGSRRTRDSAVGRADRRGHRARWPTSPTRRPGQRPGGDRLREAVPGGLFAALPGTRPTVTTSPPRRSPPGAVAVLATRPVGGPALIVVRRSGCARQAGPGRRRPAAGSDHRRDHRVGGQDHHQGPGGAAGRDAGPDGGAAGVVQQRARPSADRAEDIRADPVPGVGDGSARARAHHRAVRDRAAAARRGAVRRPRPRGRVRRPGPDRAGQGRAASRAARPTASPYSTPTTTGWPRWPRGPRPGS